MNTGDELAKPVIVDGRREQAAILKAAAEHLLSLPHEDEVLVEVMPELRDLPRAAPRAFMWARLLLPKRLYIEDLGDALEMLSTPEMARAPRWQRALKIGSTCFWLLVNTVRELTSVVHGARQKGGDQ